MTPSIQELINKHCDSLKTDVSDVIVRQGPKVYSDFSTQVYPIFLNRLSLLSTEIFSFKESGQYVHHDNTSGNLNLNSTFEGFHLFHNEKPKIHDWPDPVFSDTDTSIQSPISIVEEQQGKPYLQLFYLLRTFLNCLEVFIV